MISQLIRQVEEDSNTETQIEQQIRVAKDTIEVLGDDPAAAVDSALDAAKLEEALSNFRKGMQQVSTLLVTTWTCAHLSTK